VPGKDGEPATRGPCSLRADGHPVGGKLVGKEGMRSAAVQAGLVDRAAVGVGPVDAVGVDRHPDRAVLTPPGASCR
jgi:hypothetical protein